VLVYFDFSYRKSAPIPEDKKRLLEEHLISVKSEVATEIGEETKQSDKRG
jgi:hypothetical protein